MVSFVLLYLRQRGLEEGPKPRLAFACLVSLVSSLCWLCSGGWVDWIGSAGLAAEPGHAGEVLAEDSGQRKAAITSRVHSECFWV